jgi:hypothetical protein
MHKTTNQILIPMKKRNFNTIKKLTLSLTVCCFFVNVDAQTNSAQPVQTVTPSPLPAGASAKPMTDAEKQAQNERMKADREMNMKIGQLNKEVQEAEKAGKADTPEINAKKEELKKLQEQRNANMKAERERIMKERAANPPAGQQEMIKINQLNKEIQEAEKAGKADAPETIAKKAEVKQLQEERNAKMKAERDRMMKERPMPTPEEMEANKKMGQLNKEIKDAEKEGKGETPEIQAKKAELKKMQEARVEKMKAEREKNMKAAPVQNKSEAAPTKESK